MPSLLGGHVRSGWFLSTAPRIWQSLVRCSPGSTVDTCYVSLQRLLCEIAENFSVFSAMLGSTLDFGDDFVELLVFSTMLGSTVALGDDFFEFFVFSAMLGLTVTPGDNFVKMFVFSALLGSTLDLWCCQSMWPFHRCSSWTRFSCPGPAPLHIGGAAGAAHHQGHLHLVATQSLIPMALTVQQTIEISWLQFLDKELTCPLLGHTGASRCFTGASSWTRLLCPLCARQMP